MRTLAAWIVLSASVVLAQDPIDIPSFPTELKEYLAISDHQVVRMNDVRERIILLQQPKFLRQTDLILEIAQETAKAVPDPAVLGPRYAELELIRRASDALQKSLLDQTQAVLGVDQKAKLANLEQALALHSTACSAYWQNLLRLPAAAEGTIIPILGFVQPLSTACSGNSGLLYAQPQPYPRDLRERRAIAK